jgi:hypothetical protein
MDPHSPLADGEDLKAVERRLSAWRPADDGLDADAMLFAAGRASARPGRGRFVWPALAACLALTSAGLGVGLVHERAERMALARQIQISTPVPAPAIVLPRPPADEPVAPDSYLASQRALEDGLDAWPARPEAAAPPEDRRPATPPLRVGQRERLLDQ